MKTIRRGDNDVRAEVDALANGECEPAEFLRVMQDKLRADPDENWEALSLLDQYYRRGKIKADVFRAVKSSLAEFVLRPRDSGPSHVTAPATRAVHPAAAAVTPAAAVTQAAGVAQGPGVAQAAAVEPEPLREIRVGDVLRGRYRIEALLGKGGMGTVFEATDPNRLDIPPSGQLLAIKVLHTAVTKRTELVMELRREFQHLQSLSHPNIVRAFDFDRDGSAAFFTMELLQGALLGRVLEAKRKAPLPRGYALAIIRDVGAAIAHAHARGVVHGDINPQNIFITTRSEIRVLDFGAAHKMANAHFGDERELNVASFATPGFASCQVLEGDKPGPQDDVFALACVAYLLLTGSHPFGECSALEARAINMQPKRPMQVSGPQWRALRAGLNFDRKKRPADIQVWLDKFGLRGASPRLAPLAELLQPPSSRQRQFALVAAGIAALILLLAGGYWLASNNNLLPPRFAEESTPSQTTPEAAAPLSPPAPPPAVKSVPPIAAQTTPKADAPNNGASTGIASTGPSSAGNASTVTASTRSASSYAAPTSASSNSASSNSASSTSAPAAAAIAKPGAAKLEMAADTVDVPAGEDAAHVMIKRHGSLRGETTFTWWTESGTAKPGTDFSPVKAHVDSIADGRSAALLTVPLANTVRAQEKSFYVVIDENEGGASLTGRRLTMITLPPTN